MKKTLLFSFGSLFLATVTTLAQPTITAAGITGTLGEVLSIANSTVSISPGNSGANQTWNLSSMTGTATSNTLVTVGSTPNGSSFPNATIAFKGSNYYAYYKSSATAWQNYGSATTVVMAYSNPEDFIHFPFTMNNTYTDTWATTFTNTYTFYRKGSTTVTADAYGTITTPAGTFSNALRVHYVQTYQDSTYIGTPYIISYQNDEYMWYVNGNHMPIATVYTLTSNGSPSSGGSYMTNAVNSINEEMGMVKNYSLFPNPAVDNVELSFNLTEPSRAEIKIFNSLGGQAGNTQTIEAMAGENKYKVNLQGLAGGIYFAQLILNGQQVATRRFVIEK